MLLWIVCAKNYQHHATLRRCVCARVCVFRAICVYNEVLYQIGWTHPARHITTLRVFLSLRWPVGRAAAALCFQRVRPSVRVCVFAGWGIFRPGLPTDSLVFFPARRYANAGISSGPLSVCLSQVGVLWKRMNESSWVLAWELSSTSPVRSVVRKFGYLRK